MSILHLLKRNFGKSTNTPGAEDSIRKIVDELDKIDTEKAKFIACFAYLLSRIARADLNISPEETYTMEKIIQEQSGLPPEQAIVVVQMAKAQNLIFGGTENYLVAREFRELSTQEERLILLDCLFAIAAAHESISTVEDNEISQIADELRIEHPDFIYVRSKYRDHLSVLKKDA
jgi:uncharacterized tellurite resistance protein B-like protein